MAKIYFLKPGQKSRKHRQIRWMRTKKRVLYFSLFLNLASLVYVLYMTGVLTNIFESLTL